MADSTRPGGMLTFITLWLGQLVSMLGTNMSRFALIIWVWEQTGEATSIMLITIFSAVPSLLLQLVAGALVDRWDRRRVMMVSDTAAGLSTLAILLLYNAGNLQVWHLYVVAAVTGSFGAFQSLAYSTAITTMLPKTQYARAAGMNSLAQYTSLIGAPVLAGILLGVIGISGILLIDVITFVVAVGALLVVHIPPPETVETEEPKPLWADSVFGIRYIAARPGLLGLTLIAFTFTMAESLGYPLIAPMILARTGNDEIALGTVQGVLGLGGVTGGVLISVWGGPKRRIHAILVGFILTGLLGDALMGLGQSLAVWIVAAFFLEVFIPLVLGPYQSIWQSKVPPDIQGRVFAARGLITTVAEPVSMALAGLLADHVLEPGMMPGGALAGTFGGLVGTGAGAGMALLLVFCGVSSALAGVAGYAFSAVREVENVLPDHDMGVKVSA
jgi:MFS family permease